MSSSNRSQGKLIALINQYLKWNNLPIEWNVGGVCRGLAIIHAQYTLQGKEAQFYKMLDKISAMTEKDSLDTRELDPSEDVDHFIHQVLLAFRPDLWDKQYSQDDSHKMIKVGDKPLDSDFHLAMVTTAENWEKIIRDEINMQENETFLVSSGVHAVSVHRKNGQYTIYDPNYSKGKKTFKNEKDLVNELRTNVFHQNGPSLFHQLFPSKTIGLSFQNLTRSDLKPEISRRSVQEIYKDYFKPGDLSKTYFTFGKEMPAAFMSIKVNDKSFVEYLINEIQPSEEDLNLMRYCSLDRNHEQVFEVLNNRIQQNMSPKEKAQDIENMLMLSIVTGSPKVFNQISSLDQGEHYLKFFNSEEKAKEILGAAASGGQPDILKQIISDIKTFGVSLEKEVSSNDMSFSPMRDTHVRDIITLSNKPLPAKNNSKNVERNYSIGTLILQKDARVSGMDILNQAIESNSHESVSILLNELRKENVKLPAGNIAGYLESAISKNNIYMVDSILDLLDKKEANLLLGNMSMSVTQAKQTNIHILNSLQEKGARFSPQVNDVIKEKSSHELSPFEFMGIKIASFIEFVKDQFGLQKHLDIQKNTGKLEQFQSENNKMNDRTSIHSFKDFKSKLSIIKTDYTSESENVHTTETTHYQAPKIR